MIEIRLATHADAWAVATNLRAVDREEVIATAGSDVTGAVEASYRASELCWFVSLEGRPVAIFGVVPDSFKGHAFPWLVGTDLLEKHAKELLRESRWYVELMNRMYPVLTNFVDARNTRTQRWLRWCGFQFGDTIPEFGAGRKPFIHFYRNLNVS